MNTAEISMNDVSIRCPVCGLDIPADEAVVPEATDELIYMCGLDCYARWRSAASTSFPALAPKEPSGDA
jgi:hypothetical protein